ncbi:carbon-nitrogen hydrolase family protein [Pseudoteredinibacter isoporae]|uniref:carbon-nitrogen hydrolase family protein n=1 Tax=Pseudoteredinibacter isoporae TaxID=570281 RepID=UPI00310C311C
MTQNNWQHLTLGLVQMVSAKSLDDNLISAERQIKACAEAGAELVVLPEMFAIFGGGDQLAAGQAEADEHGPLRTFLSSMASCYGVYLVAGSIPCTGANPYTGAPALDEMQARVYAACFVYDDQGLEVGRYDKVHLFDAQVNDAQGQYRESDTFAPGVVPQCFPSPWGNIGVAICYDLRFPEYFRQLADMGCELVLVPAAFTFTTGEAHWELLLKARAVENQCYLAGAAQGGDHSQRRSTWGHSCVIDPWGKALASLKRGEGHLICTVERQRLLDVRQALPALNNRRLR